MSANNYRIERVKVKTKDIIDPLIEKIEKKISVLDRIGEMKESGEMTWEEEKWLGRYLGVYCSVRNVITPSDERAQELLDLLFRNKCQK